MNAECSMNDLDLLVSVILHSSFRVLFLGAFALLRVIDFHKRYRTVVAVVPWVA